MKIASMITNKQLHVLGKFLDRPLQLVGDKNDVPILKENGLNVQGYISIAKHITRTSKQHALLGKTPTEKALVDQWLEYVSLHLQDNSERASNLQELNQFLADRVYLLGHFVSLADMLLYFTLHETFNELTFCDKEKYIHVSRWFDNMQYHHNFANMYKLVKFHKTLLYSSS